jgi:hypothetical protein
MPCSVPSGTFSGEVEVIFGGVLLVGGYFASGMANSKVKMGGYAAMVVGILLIFMWVKNLFSIGAKKVLTPSMVSRCGPERTLVKKKKK